MLPLLAVYRLRWRTDQSSCPSAVEANARCACGTAKATEQNETHAMHPPASMPPTPHSPRFWLAFGNGPH